MQLLKVSEGFEFLQFMDWIESEVVKWREELLFDYPEKVDRCVQQGLNIAGTPKLLSAKLEDLPHKVLRFNMPMFEFSSDL